MQTKEPPGLLPAAQLSIVNIRPRRAPQQARLIVAEPSRMSMERSYMNYQLSIVQSALGPSPAGGLPMGTPGLMRIHSLQPVALSKAVLQ